jgi:hypothetical protein
MQPVKHIICLLLIVVIIACKKQKEDPPVNQQPTVTAPVANAGSDITIYLPTNSTTLNGHASIHPGGASLQYSWTQLSGPSQVAIVDPNTEYGKVATLIAGTYEFRLQVKILSGASDDDTLMLTVHPLPQVPANISITPIQLLPVTTLPFERKNTCVVTTADKIFFAGGVVYTPNSNGAIISFSRVDVYDVNTQTWSTAELSQPRFRIVGASSGNKIVFAGGIKSDGVISDRVDIYDVSANSWATAGLSQARNDLAVASSGDKILFAGGGDYSPWDFPLVTNRVDIYDASANSWSNTTLSQARGSTMGVASNNKLVFAGGYSESGGSNRIDIYDIPTGAWTTASLNKTDIINAGIASNNTVHFVRSIGGNSNSFFTRSRVEQLNLSTGTLAVQLLQQFDFLSPLEERRFAGAAVSGNYAVFVPENLHHFLIYNTINQTWSVSSPIQPLTGITVVSINNQIYIATTEKLWKVQF